MAPKRSSVASKGQAPKSPQKRAKIAAPAAPEAPLLTFLGTVDDIPKPCRDMLQVALPHCLGVDEGERHRFQAQVLDSVANILADVERKKREAITEAQAQLASVEVEKDTQTADRDKQKAAAEAKKSECDEKGKAVEAASEVAKGAKQALANAQQAEAASAGKKATLLGEQERFAKLLADTFQPLKDGALPSNQWQKRNKLITELRKQTEPIGLEASLCDALVATLKMKPEQREGSFAKKTLEYAEACFAKHTEKIAQDIAGLDAEATSHKDAIAAAEAALAERQGEVQKVEKEWDDMQNEWVALEDACAEMGRKLMALEQKASEVTAGIEGATGDLAEFLEVPALFAKLKDPPEAAPQESEAAADEASKTLVPSGSSYYETIDGMSCDRGVIDACRAAVAGPGDGRVSVEDAKAVFLKIADGGRETKKERWTLRYCMQEFKWTEAAHDWIVEELRKVPQEGAEPEEPAAKKAKRDGAGYYEVIDGCHCDRGIVDACREAMGGQGDGRVSREDAETVWAKAADGGKVTDAERWTLRYCLASFNWTRPAHDWLLEQLHGLAL